MDDAVDRIQQAWERERPGTPVAAIGVLTRIRLIARLVEVEQRRTLAALGGDGSTRDLLSALRRAGPPFRLAPGEIAAATLVTPGAVSQQIARAEREGLVRRKRSEADARGVLVELTDRGRERIERTVDALFASEAELLAVLGDEDRARLTALLRTLLGSLVDRA